LETEEHRENIPDANSNESKSLLIQSSEKYRSYVDTMYGNIRLNLNSWTFHYWLFFYGVIPFILLTIALFSTVLPKEIFLEYFIQKQANLISISTYISNFSHREISHLVSNLLFYLISITAIFIFEDNKKRLKICSIFFLTVVPIVGAYLTQVIWEIAHSINGQNYGFSAITIAFTGYALYIFCNWFYANTIFDFSFKYSESEILTSIRETFAMKEQPIEKMLYNIVFIIEIFLFGLVMIYVIRFGIEAGQYIKSSTGVSNGIGHFQGFFLGLLVPTIFGIFFEKTERIFNLFFVFLVLIGIWIYYSRYLSVLFIP
jgi:hypothetical protein